MASTLRALDYSIIQQCMHCGLCLPTCPTYDETKHERNSPRGRIALMRAVADQELAVTGAFADEMSYCLGCLACQTACPAGVNYAELLETARNDVEQAHVRSSPGRSFWRGVTLGYLFMHPRTLRGVGRLVGRRREDYDMRSQRMREFHAHMAQPAQAHDADLLAIAHAPVPHRRVRSDSGAE